MSFGNEYLRKQVADWRDYYVNYNYLREELDHSATLIADAYKSDSALGAERVTLKKLKEDFAFIFQGEIIKFSAFSKLTFHNTLRPRLVQLNLNIRNYKLIAEPQKRRTDYETIKRALLMHYKELHLFRNYIDSNVECVETLCAAYRKVFSAADLYEPTAVARILLSVQQSFPVESRSELERMIKSVAGLYSEFCEERWDESRAELQAIAHDAPLSAGQLIGAGAFIGILALSTIIVGLLLYEVDFFKNKAGGFVEYSFPIFRGTLTMFLFLLCFSVCILVFERCNVNYRRVFEMNSATAKPYALFRLACGLLSLWMITFMYCGFSSLKVRGGSLGAVFRTSIANWAPVGLYAVLIAYFFFPSSTSLNGGTRMFVLQTFGGAAHFAVRRLIFRESFALSQFGSARPFLRDFGYTVCYVHNLSRTGKQANGCEGNSAYRFYETLLIFFPLMVSLVQQFRTLILYPKPRLKAKIWPFIGPSLSLLTALEPYINRASNPFTALITLFFRLLISVNTIISYYDDVTDTWALAQPGSVHPFLRDALAYPYTPFYYAALAINLPLRFLWTLNLLPLFSFKSVLYRNLFGLFSLLAELARRTMSNVLQVEAKHIAGIGSFNAVQPVPLPFAAELAEVRARTEFERDYREALFQGNMQEQYLAEREALGVKPYRELDYSFNEKELVDFAKRRAAQLIKKGDKIAKTVQTVGQALHRGEANPRQSRAWNDDLPRSLAGSARPSTTRPLRKERLSAPSKWADEDDTSTRETAPRRSVDLAKPRTSFEGIKEVFKGN